MIDGRHGKFSGSARFFVVGKCGEIARFNFLMYPLVKFNGPVVGTGIIVLQARHAHAQVVHNVAAAYHQHAALAQGPQFFGQFQMVLHGLIIIDTHLVYGHISLGEQVHQDSPGSVVEPPVVRFMQQCAQFHGFFRDVRCARGRILRIKKRFWKTSEIVDRFGLGQYVDITAPGKPVRRNDQNGAWFLFFPQRFTHFTQAACKRVVFQRVHRAAVPHKPHRHFFRNGKRSRYFRKILKFHITGCDRPQGHRFDKVDTIQGRSI